MPAFTAETEMHADLLRADGFESDAIQEAQQQRIIFERRRAGHPNCPLSNFIKR
jgi:hypothetical protein